MCNWKYVRPIVLLRWKLRGIRQSLNLNPTVRMNMALLLVRLNLVCLILASLATQLNGTREKKLFSLFNVVQFKNDACSTQSDPSTQGTCLSPTECATRSGSADGKCASGFGVCCAFVSSGCNGMVNENCTYIRNAGFPRADTTVSQACTYGFNRLSNGMCQIRLDFNYLQLSVDDVEAGRCGNAGDSLMVRSPFSTFGAAFPPAICGSLTGQHLYFESGTTGNAGTMTITTGTGIGDRRYNIKVTYIECLSASRPPSGCTQYFTGASGTISSYNHAGGQMLQAQMYTNCIRQELGYCQTLFKERTGTTPDPFELGNAVAGGGTSSTQSACATNTHVLIPSTVQYQKMPILRNANGMTVEVDYIPSFRCGEIFGGLTDEDQFTEPASLTSLRNVPFEIRVSSRNTPQNNLIGFSLDYNQVSC